MSVAFADAYRGRSVLVTGHTGFKGSWLALWLDRLGARVTGYSLAPPHQPNHFEAAGIRARLVDHHERDVRDRDALRDALGKAAPSVVFHLAAQALVRPGYERPEETFDVNVMGTIALLEAVRELGSRCAVVVVTSDKCYENREQAAPFREGDALGGKDPYSASKAAAEIAVAAYRRSFFAGAGGASIASARAGNVIGGGDWSQDRIVPDCVRAWSAGRPAGVRNPDSRRPWQHVLEPLGGYLTLAAGLLEGRDPALADSWNFGPGREGEATVREVVELLLREWGGGSWSHQKEAAAPAEAGQLRLDASKAKERLSWRPRWSLEEAVRRTARWYRCHRERGGGPGSMADASLAEIADYEAA